MSGSEYSAYCMWLCYIECPGSAWGFHPVGNVHQGVQEAPLDAEEHLLPNE